MKGRMEKEEKSIFERLMDFRKEKIGMAEADGIGFWTEEKEKRIFAAERERGGFGAVFLSEKSRRNFWEQEDFAEKEIRRKEELAAEGQEKKTEHLETTRLFFAEGLREGQKERKEKSGIGRAFWTEAVTGEQAERRKTVPIVSTVAEKKKTPPAAEEQRTPQKQEKTEKEERSEIDIERLMRQMTKRLWEERESCGRRLR